MLRQQTTPVETLGFLCALDNVFMVGTGTRGSIKADVFATPRRLPSAYLTWRFPKDAVILLRCYGSADRMVSLKVPLLNLGGGIQDDGSGLKQRFGSRKIPFKCLKQIYRARNAKTCRQVSVDRADLTAISQRIIFADRDPTP